MVKLLLKYFKPFTAMLFLSIALLFIQAVCELNLPNLMSNIINTGIQQSGIEGSAPEALSKSSLNLMTKFMTDNEKGLVLDNYVQIKASDTDLALYIENINKYPLLKNEDIYVLDAADKDAANTLNLAFGKSAHVLFSLTGQHSWGAEDTENGYDDISGIDFNKIHQLPIQIDGGLLQDAIKAREIADKMPESMLNQTGVLAVKGFYNELGVDVSKIQSGYIFNTGWVMVLIALLGGVATISVAFFSSRIAAGFAKILRRDVFKKVEGFSNIEFDKFSTASLITRATNDITQIQLMMVFGIRMVCYAPIMGIGSIFMALNKSLSMGWVLALAVILLICLIMTVFSIAMPKIKIAQKLIDRLNLVTRENLNGLMVVRAFGTQNFEEGRFDEKNTDLTNNQLFITRTLVYMMPLMTLIMNGITLLVVWVGAHQIAASSMQVGDMMAFIQYAMHVIMSFFMISMMFIMLPRAAVSGERINEVLNTENTILDPVEYKEFDALKHGVIEFENVSFRYEGAFEDALHDISFTAGPGRTTAFIGATGSGKSTLVNLILRFYDVTSGRILVNGIDVRQCRQFELRQDIGYVPQRAVLFSGSIDSNLRYGKKEASFEDVEQAAKISQALDFIENTEDGFKSKISQGGSNLSGGQKQRMAIARALVKKPKIYIFDDSFSALDFKTEAALRNALKKRTKDATVLIVAQRVSSIMNADQIIVLDKGTIAGIGTHSELLKTSPVYYEIASSQLKKEELE